jgi:hypothetical protein
MSKAGEPGGVSPRTLSDTRSRRSRNHATRLARTTIAFWLFEDPGAYAARLAWGIDNRSLFQCRGVHRLLGILE